MRVAVDPGAPVPPAGGKTMCAACPHPHTPCCRMEIISQDTRPPIVCQGPPPPNPLVIERFQGVVSQLFQQVRRRGGLWAGQPVTPVARCIDKLLVGPRAALSCRLPFGAAWLPREVARRVQPPARVCAYPPRLSAPPTHNVPHQPWAARGNPTTCRCQVLVHRAAHAAASHALLYAMLSPFRPRSASCALAAPLMTTWPTF